MIVAALRGRPARRRHRAEPRGDPEPPARGRGARARARASTFAGDLQGRRLREPARPRRAAPTTTRRRRPSTSSSPGRPGSSRARSTARRSTCSSSTRPASSRSPTPPRSGSPRANLVLLGDPQQLPQVTQADHPGGSGASVLEHLLDGARDDPRGPRRAAHGDLAHAPGRLRVRLRAQLRRTPALPRRVRGLRGVDAPHGALTGSRPADARRRARGPQPGQPRGGRGDRRGAAASCSPARP